MIIGNRKGTESRILEVALIIDMTPKIIKNPLNRTRVGEDRNTILEKTEHEFKTQTVSIPAPYLHISGFQPRETDSIAHVASVGDMISQMVIAVLQNGLRENRGERSRRDDGGGGWRHDSKARFMGKVVEVVAGS